MTGLTWYLVGSWNQRKHKNGNNWLTKYAKVSISFWLFLSSGKTFIGICHIVHFPVSPSYSIIPLCKERCWFTVNQQSIEIDYKAEYGLVALQLKQNLKHSILENARQCASLFYCFSMKCLPSGWQKLPPAGTLGSPWVLVVVWLLWPCWGTPFKGEWPTSGSPILLDPWWVVTHRFRNHWPTGLMTKLSFEPESYKFVVIIKCAVLSFLQEDMANNTVYFLAHS